MAADLHHTEYAALAAFQQELQRLMAKNDYRTRQAGLLPEHYPAMLAIKKRGATGDAATIGTLAPELGLDRAAVIDVIKELERRGFVARKRDERDRRRVLVSLTAQGEQWLAPLVADALRDLSASGPEILRALRAAVTCAAAVATRPSETPGDVSAFVWRGSGPAIV